MSRFVLWSTLVAVLTLLAGTPASAQQRFALLVGNLSYKPEVGRLDNPKRDTDLIAGALKQIGFAQENIIQRTDVTGEELRQALRQHVEAVKAAGEGAISFFYYSGHGAAAPKRYATKGSNYLITMEIQSTKQPDFWQRALSLEEIGEILKEASQARHIVIFDACRNVLELPDRSARRGFQAFVVAESVQMYYAFATAPDTVAYDSWGNEDKDKTNSPFAKALAAELTKPGLDHMRLFYNVRLAVMEQTQRLQIPWWQDGLLQALYLGPPLSSIPDPHARCEILNNQAKPLQLTRIEWSEVPDKRWIRFKTHTHTYDDARANSQKIDEVEKDEAHQAAEGTKIFVGNISGQPAWYRYNRAFGAKKDRYVAVREAELR